ncbi:class I SAM-dependent methyltransferase [Melghirimyces profundicolus]|uniref:class I SAM-dependent methyltransferase n=1 Tax=Melghirimyces profundicolus TaxID=1242148 RepID=UPI001FE7D6AD|nr:class I SAM-dependent methyltransferase [Melghirimyces profundicolus]
MDHFPVKEGHILDFGSGTGANCPIFSPEGYIGIDPDHRRIAYAKKLYPEYTFDVFKHHRFPVEDKSMDYILIVAVLHHIASEEIHRYMKEFRRILKTTGTIIVIEPCLFADKPLSNRLMTWFDHGEYIRNEKEYLHLFQHHHFHCQVLKRFRKGLFYHELFFCAQHSGGDGGWANSL